MMSEPSSSCLRFVPHCGPNHQNTQVMQGTSPCQRQPSLSQHSLQNRQPSTHRREWALGRLKPQAEVQPAGAASPPVAEAVSEGAEATSLWPVPPASLLPEPADSPVAEASLSPVPPVAPEPEEASSDSWEPVAVEVDVAASPPAASDNLVASAAAVGSALVAADDAPAVDGEEDVEDDKAEDDVEGVVNPAGGRSGRRTSMYSAPVAFGEASTRASDIHLACGRVELPK